MCEELNQSNTGLLCRVLLLLGAISRLVQAHLAAGRFWQDRDVPARV